MYRFVLKNTFTKIYIYHFLINIFIKISSQSYVLETVSLSKTTLFFLVRREYTFEKKRKLGQSILFPDPDAFVLIYDRAGNSRITFEWKQSGMHGSTIKTQLGQKPWQHLVFHASQSLGLVRCSLPENITGRAIVQHHPN